ncbi:MAG: ATP-binding protein [Candidatus Brocadiia bacterium]
MSLNDLTGHERARSLLQAHLKTGTVSHAILLVGPGGVGRLQLARELAATLLCQQNSLESCGKCESCRRFNSGNNPDYFEVGVPEGKQYVPIDAIRGGKNAEYRGIQEESSVKPVTADVRVFVIRDVERFTLPAANCFLKTLEEPPGESYFILVATSLRDIPETIVSRCQIVRLSGLPAEDVARQLQQEETPPQVARWLAHRTWGSPGQARRLQEFKLPEFNDKLVEALAALSMEKNFQLADAILDKSSEISRSAAEQRAAIREILECAAVFYRDLAAIGLNPDLELFNEEKREVLRKTAEKIPVDRALECAEMILKTQEEIDFNANKKLALDSLFSRLAASQEKL